MAKRRAASNPKLDGLLRVLGADRDALAAAVNASQVTAETEDRARRKVNLDLARIGQTVKLGPGEDLIATVDGVTWHLEVERGALRVSRVK